MKREGKGWGEGRWVCKRRPGNREKLGSLTAGSDAEMGAGRMGLLQVR